MLECEITRNGILYYAVEKGKTDSINGRFYDNVEEAYSDTCKFLRNAGIGFCLIVPAALYE